MTISRYEIERLRALPLFGNLPLDSIAELLTDALVQVHTKRKTIFVQGDPVRHFFVVLSGWVKLYRLNAEGAEVVLGVFGPGESFAEGAMHLPGGYPVSAEMIEEGRLLEVPTDAFRRRLKKDPDLAISMMLSMATRLKGFVNRIEKSQTQSAPQRVADFLLKFAPDPDGDRADVVIRLPYDKQLIANRLGMKPETFSRALVTLKKKGVAVKGSDASIRDVPSLKHFAAPD